jgi:hypothetical protein
MAVRALLQDNELVPEHQGFDLQLPWRFRAFVLFDSPAQCAWAATRTKATYLHAQFLRLRGRRGPKKAICAVAASILTAAYHMLKDGTFYEDLGSVHFDRRRPETQARRLVKRLAELGFSVELKPAAAVS